MARKDKDSEKKYRKWRKPGKSMLFKPGKEEKGIENRATLEN